MGKIRIKALGDEDVEKKQLEDAKKRREAKKQLKIAEGTADVAETGAEAGANKADVENADKTEKKAKKVERKEDDAKTEDKNEARKSKTVKKTGKKQASMKKKVDAKKEYPLKEAVALLRTLSYVKFDESVELHINLKDKDVKGEITMPHGTGKQIKVAIADDALIADLENGTIDFDILIAHPSFMPKLVKYARVLGPKGLMPNPKNGTVSDAPEKAADKFKGGSLRYKAEPKFPLMHQIVGKMSFTDEQLVANIEALMKAIDSKKINGAFLSGSMTPSVRVVVA